MKKIILIFSSSVIFSLLTGCATSTQSNQTLAGMTQILQQTSSAAAAAGVPQTSGVSQTAQQATQVVGLIDILVQQMGISQTQAQVGAGTLFQVAKTQMQASAFSQLEKAVPGMNTLLSAATAAKQPSALGTLGGLAAAATGNSSVGSAVALASAFQQQGLSPSMVQSFVPIVLQYVTNTGGSPLASALSMALVGR